MKFTFNDAPLFCDVCHANRDLPGWSPRTASPTEAEGEYFLDEAAPCVALCAECRDRMRVGEQS